MRPGGCEGDLLGRLAWTPLLDRLEMVCVSGWSRAAVYEAVRRLEEGGLAASIPHAAELTPRPGATSSPPAACGGWPGTRTPPPYQVRGRLWTACCARAPSRPSGGAS